MAKTVDAEVFEGLKALQVQLETARKDVEIYTEQRDRAEATRATAQDRLDAFQAKLDAARTKYAIPREDLVFDDASLEVKTVSEVAAAAEAAK